MKELDPVSYDKVRALFRAFDHSLSIHAAMEGNSPGRIFVDHLDQPRTAPAFTVKGTLLAGDNGDPATHQALHRFFKEKVFRWSPF